MATEMIMGKSIHEAMELTNKAVAEALDGLPAHKMHCSVLAEEAIKNALQDYFEKNNIPYDKSKFKEIDHDELHAQVHGDE
jgi:nitrogen fixation NifU-like protein